MLASVTPSSRLRRFIIWPAILLLAAGCSYMSQGVMNSADRNAIIAVDDYFADSNNSVVYLPQNWDATDSLWFYNTTQGSNLMPLDIFLQLEQADSSELFRSDANMRRFRYLTQKPSMDNKHGLPVGWVKNSYQNRDYVGFTCAACHTAQINYQGVGIRIDGAPTLADMETMMAALEAALTATTSDKNKFQRLVNNLDEGPTALRARLNSTTAEISNYNRINASTHTSTSGDVQQVPYGYGRLDAFGRIYNRVMAHLTPGIDNFNSANAPVSYPFLWDTPQHDFVQWNGVSDNAYADTLSRNTGEVIGVFADFDLRQQKGDVGYRSSANTLNQVRLKRHVKSLQSPLWQDAAALGVLPAIDQSLATRGRTVFIDYQCHPCHEAIDRSDKDRLVIAQFSSLKLIGTDTQMAMNALTNTGKSGLFEGTKINHLDSSRGDFGPNTPVLTAVTKVTMGVLLEPDHDKNILHRWADQIYDELGVLVDKPIKNTQRHLDFEIVDKKDARTLLAYKGRPLNGIWATAPYLHNGSVANLDELFLPSCSNAEITSGKACRSQTFTVGARELDPINVGFVQPNKSDYPALFTFDTRLPGNSNQGHEYTSGITPVIVRDASGKPIKNTAGNFQLATLPVIDAADRAALVEYLKTL